MGETTPLQVAGVPQPDGRIYLDRDALSKQEKRYYPLRRFQDVVLSLLALVVLSPLMLLVALLIVLDDPSAGPIYVQHRVGRDGKLFRFYKFRSMRKNAEAELTELLDRNEMDGPVFKIKKDPRITRVGRVIRRISVDELPQLVNVLRGDMSIVGPRPALPREVEQYDDYQLQRLWVRPGLTCYWQTQPHRNDMSFDQWLALDLAYIQQRSFLVDWKIIFQTFRAVFWAQGE